MAVDMKQRIRTWCEQVGLFQEEIEDDTLAFRLRVVAPATARKAPGEFNIDVLDITQPKEDSDRVVVTAGIEFDESFSGPMKEFEGADEVMLNLEMTLDSRRELYLVDYTDGVLRSVIVFEEIFEDGLTKDRLMRALRSVNKTLVVALWVLRPLIRDLGADPDTMLDVESPEEVTAAAAAEGHPRAAEEVADRQCPDCGVELPGAGRFCSHCGARVG